MYWLRQMSREELSEKLVNLRDDFYTLKKFSCRQEDKIKKFVLRDFLLLFWFEFSVWLIFISLHELQYISIYLHICCNVFIFHSRPLHLVFFFLLMISSLVKGQQSRVSWLSKLWKQQGWRTWCPCYLLCPISLEPWVLYWIYWLHWSSLKMDLTMNMCFLPIL